MFVIRPKVQGIGGGRKDYSGETPFVSIAIDKNGGTYLFISSTLMNANKGRPFINLYYDEDTCKIGLHFVSDKEDGVSRKIGKNGLISIKGLIRKNCLTIHSAKRISIYKDNALGCDNFFSFILPIKEFGHA